MAQGALLSVLAPSLCCLFAAAAVVVLADEEAEELPRSEALTLVVDPGDITLPRQQHFADSRRRRRRRRKHVREEEKEETVGGREGEEENVTPASDVLRTAPTNPPKIMVRGGKLFLVKKLLFYPLYGIFISFKKNSSGFQMKPTTLILHNHIQEAAAALQGYTKRAKTGGDIDDSIQEWGRRSDLPKRRQASSPGKTKTKTTSKPRERRKRTRHRFRPRAREKGSSSSAAPTATAATAGRTHLPSSPSPAPTTTPPSSSSSTEYVYTVLPLGAVPESSMGGGGSSTFSSQSESPPHVVLPSPTSQASYLDIPDFFGRFAQLQSFESKRRNGVPSSSTVRSVVPTGHRRNEASSSSSPTLPATEATVRHSVEAPPPSSVATTYTQPMGSDNDGILVTHLGAAKEGEKDFKEEEEEDDEKHPEFLEAEYDSSLELRSSPSSLHHHTRSPLQDLPRLTDIIWGDRAADGGGGLSFAEMLGGTGTFPVSTTFHVGSGGTTAVEASSPSSSAVIEHAPDRKEEEKHNPPPHRFGEQQLEHLQGGGGEIHLPGGGDFGESLRVKKASSSSSSPPPAPKQTVEATTTKLAGGGEKGQESVSAVGGGELDRDGSGVSTPKMKLAEGGEEEIARRDYRYGNQANHPELRKGTVTTSPITTIAEEFGSNDLASSGSTPLKKYSRRRMVHNRYHSKREKVRKAAFLAACFVSFR